MSAGMEHKTWKYPDAIENELLLAHIPPAIRKTCDRSNAFDKDVFLRAVECSQGVPEATVKYMYAHTATAMKAYSTNRITAAGLQLGNGNRCDSGSEGADRWFLSNDIVHIERAGKRASGRVLCFAAAERETIEWTDNATGIYAVASRPFSKRRALYAWWRDKAGPRRAGDDLDDRGDTATSPLGPSRARFRYRSAKTSACPASSTKPPASKSKRSRLIRRASRQGTSRAAALTRR